MLITVCWRFPCPVLACGRLATASLPKCSSQSVSRPGRWVATCSEFGCLTTTHAASLFDVHNPVHCSAERCKLHWRCVGRMAGVCRILKITYLLIYLVTPSVNEIVSKFVISSNTESEKRFLPFRVRTPGSTACCKLAAGLRLANFTR